LYHHILINFFQFLEGKLSCVLSDQCDANWMVIPYAVEAEIKKALGPPPCAKESYPIKPSNEDFATLKDVCPNLFTNAGKYQLNLTTKDN